MKTCEHTRRLHTWRLAGYDEPDFVASDHVVTTVLLVEGPKHDRVALWNRGGLAGDFVVTLGDGHRIASMLTARMVKVVDTTEAP